MSFQLPDTRSKSVTQRQEFSLKNRLNHPLDRRLDDSVFDGRDAQRARFPARFWYVYTPYSLGLIFSLLKVPRPQPVYASTIPLTQSKKTCVAGGLSSRSGRTR